MASAVQQVLTGREGNYLMPFFWQHGSDEKTLRNLIARIDECSISEFCVESRPHPDFAGPGWWRDMDIILDEAAKRDMRVWVLDDKNFPTGFAAGTIKTKYPEHRRRFLTYFAIDAMGPDADASFIIDSLTQYMDDGRLVAVVAGRRIDEGADWNTADPGVTDLVDLTHLVKGGKVHWSVPEGLHSIVAVFSTLATDNLYLLNPISKAAVQCQIKEVYEPHLAHYGHLFGKTFAGFFSDEPQFANGGWSSVMGTDMQLPWSDEMEAAFSVRLGEKWREVLPSLWLDGDARAERARYAYMDEVTRLYGECFSGQLGAWCHEHGLEYVGHQVEDNNSHSRLGSGTGHYFRCQDGQDVAGVDIVMHQIHPGYDMVSRHWHSRHTLTDGEFFHYGLIKLASSMAHTDPTKHGVAMCENFGAYGWMEGLRLMKWLADHCLVRGVNRYTPHAFTDSAFPEWDSPPHFYAQGNNPQYRFMPRFFRYMNRMCHLITGGTHIADCLLLYQADAEWWGDAMLTQKPARELMQNQIDFDIIPCDAFGDGRVSVEGKDIRVGGETYRSLVIPGAKALPEYFLKKIQEMADAGAKIFFVGSKPEYTSDGQKAEDVPGEVVWPGTLADTLKAEGLVHMTVEPAYPRLRTYHYLNGGEHVFMFFNEDPKKEASFQVELPVDGPYCLMDVMENRAVACEADGRRVSLNLEAYESVVLIAGGELPVEAQKPMREVSRQEIGGLWKISTADVHSYPAFTAWQETEELTDVNAPDRLPDFTGTFRYETAFEAKAAPAALLKLERVYETAEVWVNGQHAGVRMSAPYTFDVSGMLKDGENELVIEVTNTLAKQVADYSSAIVPQEPGGLLAKPVLKIME